MSPTTGQFPVVPAPAPPTRPAPRRRMELSDEPSPIADDVAAAFAPGGPWSAEPTPVTVPAPAAPTPAGDAPAVEVVAAEVTASDDRSGSDQATVIADAPKPTEEPPTETAPTGADQADTVIPDAGASDAATADAEASVTATSETAPSDATTSDAATSEATTPSDPEIQSATDAEPSTDLPGQSRNTAPGGFESHRTPSARAPKRPMPDTASPADAAARSAAARSSARSVAGPGTPTRVPRRGGNQRNNDIAEAAPTAQIIAPRQEVSEPASSLAVFFEADERAPVEPMWPAATMHVPSGHRADTPVPIRGRRKKIKDPRSPVVGLASLLLFAFIATFFAWFSAAPLWLTLGHGRHGVAVVANCPVDGIDKRCAEFTATDASFSATVTLLGPASQHAPSGTKLAAQMVSDRASTAYAGDTSSLYLRWGPGIAIALLCGLGIAWSTGSFRLPSRRGRIVTVLFSLFTPIALIAGMLAATY